MKRIFKSLSVFSLLLFTLGFVSCSNDDDQPKEFTQLPQAAQSFLSTYFMNATYSKIDYDKGDMEYKVELSNGYDITFNMDGDWVEVDAPEGMTIPEGIAPTKISDYVSQYYANYGINDIEVTYMGYNVELTNGLELQFNKDGNTVNGNDSNPSDGTSSTNLPETAQAFITTYFPNVDITSTEYDQNDMDYEVILANGFDLTFNQNGDWTDVDAPEGQTIPDGIAPESISNYVMENYPDYGINEIEINANGYTVDLTNGYDLMFNTQGEYTGMNVD